MDDGKTTCKDACSKMEVFKKGDKKVKKAAVKMRCSSPAPKSKSTASKFTCEEPGGAKREVKGLKGPEDTKEWCHCVAVGK